MKVLMCHNYYRQRGGEDQAFEDEVWLLKAHGHKVTKFEMHNNSISTTNRLRVAYRTIWNRQAESDLRKLIHAERPDLMHYTNTFPLMSQAVHYASRESRVPVVQSLHNFRTSCLNAFHFRNQAICEDCVGKLTPWPGVVHKCYRESRAASTVVALMVSCHRVLRTGARTIDMYLTPSEFARRKLIENGLPEGRVYVKPNFVRDDRGIGTRKGHFAVFAGRLSSEKGIHTLLEAWARLTDDLPLKILGDGPLSRMVSDAAAQDPRIKWLGWRPMSEVLSVVSEATFLVVPSTGYETFGRTAIEAFSTGTPVIASRLGALAELVANRKTGLHFEPGNPTDLVNTVRSLMSDPTLKADIGTATRREYETRYTPEQNYDMLMGLYERAIASARK